MNEIVHPTRAGDIVAHSSSVEIVTRAELVRCLRWAKAFSNQRKDHRYYDLVEDAIRQGFEHRHFLLRDERGEVIAVQPFFILDQDLVAGSGRWIRALARFIRRLWPRFMQVRTLMVGCAAGEGHLDGEDELSRHSNAQLLASVILRHARDLNAKLIVLKEFPAKYRTALECFLQCGFTRVPSLPMTRLNIGYTSFDDYLDTALSSGTRQTLRRKFRKAERAPAIEMSVIQDVTPIIDDIYPLYLHVYERSNLQFEKLTKEYFCGLGQRMPDKVRFFVWRQNGSIIAFSLCMIQGDTIYSEYLGLDYRVAFDLHLYYYAFRDVVTWAMANGYRWMHSSGLNYDPKLHLRSELDPLDLYVRHTSEIFNTPLKWILPLIEPTRYDKTLPQFPNYHELWGRA